MELHIDTAGPLPGPSIGGNKYVVLTCVDKIGFLLVDFVATKDQIPGKVEKMILSLNCIPNKRVAIVQTDNGTEFKNHKLAAFFEKENILHELSTVYTPQQNRTIERQLQTVIRKANATLIDSGLPTNLWAEAINLTIYSSNLLLGPDSLKRKFEMLTNRKPSAINLRRLGELAVVKINDR